MTGGKAKPLKAPKKAAKDMDEDDKAFLEKKRAGMSRCGPTNDANTISSIHEQPQLTILVTTMNRGEGAQGDGSQGWRQRPVEHWRSGHQEERQEVKKTTQVSTRDVHESTGAGHTEFLDSSRPEETVLDLQYIPHRVQCFISNGSFGEDEIISGSEDLIQKKHSADNCAD